MFEVGDVVTVLPTLKWKSRIGGVYINLEKYRMRGRTLKIIGKFYDKGRARYYLDGNRWEEFSDMCFQEYTEGQEKLRAFRELTEINPDELLAMIVV